MKNLIIVLLIFCLPNMVTASESCTTNTSAEIVEDQMVISTDVPKFLEGAVIIVRTKDGRESVVPAEKFKVVPRKQQYLVTKTKQSSQTTCKANEKNRLSVLAGNGPKGGLSTTKSADQVTVESKVGTVTGVQYQRKTDIEIFGMPLNGGLQLQSNESVMGVIGVDF